MFFASDTTSGDFVFKIKFKSTSGRGERTPTVVTYEEDPNEQSDDDTPVVTPEPESEESEVEVVEEPDPVVEETEEESEPEEVIVDNNQTDDEG